MIASCGISFTNATYVEVCSAGVEKEFDAAYTNWFDPSHGVIVCNENYKSRDKHTGDKDALVVRIAVAILEEYGTRSWTNGFTSGSCCPSHHRQ
ncbi:hypothetical protein Ptr902_03484 [Pyrenophora tritici-repentis]|nr:hypothetical protein Ptr902_03484 [Pyrenophora tritici-repentis]